MRSNTKHIMTYIKKTLFGREGASLVLVTIIAIIIITGVVILRVTTGSLLASADKQLNQDRAYMTAVSLGDAIDEKIKDGKLTDLNSINGYVDSAVSEAFGIPDSYVGVSVTESAETGLYTVTVSSKVADAEYDYDLIYLKNGSTFVRQY